MNINDVLLPATDYCPKICSFKSINTNHFLGGGEGGWLSTCTR